MFIQGSFIVLAIITVSAIVIAFSAAVSWLAVELVAFGMCRAFGHCRQASKRVAARSTATGGWARGWGLTHAE
ncbi:MAG TPA: hypothetical protein VN743_13180 [Blastocatellia bacterium]|nr:hypothetical protein [Blastocatellia bacterium]